MENILKVHNIKCGGCEASIKDKLSQMKDLDDIKVDHMSGEIRFTSMSEEASEAAKAALAKMGYTEGDPTMLQTAKSYVSCMIGKTKS